MGTARPERVAAESRREAAVRPEEAAVAVAAVEVVAEAAAEAEGAEDVVVEEVVASSDAGVAFDASLFGYTLLILHSCGR